MKDTSDQIETIDVAPFHDLLERSFDYLIRSVNEQLKEEEEGKSLSRAKWLLDNAENTLEQAARFIIETAAVEKLKRLQD